MIQSRRISPTRGGCGRKHYIARVAAACGAVTLPVIAIATLWVCVPLVSRGQVTHFNNSGLSRGGSCPYASVLPDGCSGAQHHGVIVNPHLADTQTVVAINVLGGSGYTNGTGYAWTSSGGGCSSNAAGTIDVAGGALTNPVISSAGSGCTFRPTIASRLVQEAGRSGGSLFRASTS